MTKEKRAAVMTYKATVAVFKTWLAQGLISAQDYVKTEQAMASKYGLSLYSIWRDLP